MPTPAALNATEPAALSRLPGASAGRSSTAISDNIAVARVICICGIVYVHAWTGLDIDGLRAQGGSWHSMLYWTLIELFGRSSVPLLSVISGWLVARSVSRRSYGCFVSGKAKSLLLPMILWNLIAATLVIVLARYGGLRAPQPELGLPLLNEILHFTAPAEINVQNAFLRDVFVCMLAAPLLVRLPSAVLAVLAAGLLAWAVEGWQLYLLLRPQILLFFVLGILACRTRFDRVVDGLPVLPLTVAFGALGVGKCWLSIWGQHHLVTHPEAVAGLDNLLRLVAAAFFWRLSGMVARSRWGTVVKGLESYTFLLFCSHVLLIWLLCPVIGPWFGRFGEPGYPLFLLLQPLLALGGAVVTGQVLIRTWPAAALILSGGRLSRPASDRRFPAAAKAVGL